MVRSMFSAEVADQVLQIPVSRFKGDDFVLCPHTRSELAFLDGSRKI
jgi:hypothetical protein